MLHDDPLTETREADDDAWAGYAGAVYAAAVARREHDAGAAAES